jgi:TolB-like protein/tetratricopeptide (TPR) repeat protein
MKRPFAAYQGDEPYVFVCYAHEDAEQVYPEIQRLHEGGVRIWYDEGVTPGTRWTDELASKLTEASVVLFFCTPQSVKRKHCQNELNFAIDKDRPLLVIQDGEVDLPPGMQLQLGSHQSILKHDLSAEQFEAKLTAAINQYVVSGTPSALAVPKSARPRTRHPLAYVAVVVAAVVLTALLWRTWPSPTSESGAVAPPSVSTNVEYTVAVLPFRPLSSEPATVTFAQGLSDELVNVLSGPMPVKVRQMFPPLLYELRVVPARSTLRYRDTSEDLANIGQSLDAGYLVEGGVRSAGDQVRVTVQLIHAADNQTVWSHSYDVSATDALQAQSDVARHAARRIAWFVPDMYRVARSQFTSAAAYEIWARGNREQMDMLTGGDIDEAASLANLEKSLELESTNPWIYENLVVAYLTLMKESMGPVKTIAPIDELLAHAAELIRSGVPHIGLQPWHLDAHGAEYRLLKLEYEKSSQLLREALSAKPDDGYFLFLKSVLFLHQERLEDALAANRSAANGLGTSPMNQVGLAQLLRAHGQPSAAVKAIDSALELYPGELGRAQLLIEQANSYAALGKLDHAAALVDQAWELAGTNHPDLFPAALATTNRADRARAILRDLEAADHGRRFSPLDMIEGYVALDDLDAAFRWIDRAVDARFEPVVRWMHLVTVSVAGVWPERLTTDPRWQQAYAKLPKVEAI